MHIRLSTLNNYIYIYKLLKNIYYYISYFNIFFFFFLFKVFLLKKTYLSDFKKKKSEREMEKKKLWQSMINLDLTPDEFIKLKLLGQIREQSLRQLVSNILRQELEAFKDLIIEKETIYNCPILGSEQGAKRRVGRPRLKETAIFSETPKNKKKTPSLNDLIEDNLKD